MNRKWIGLALLALAGTCFAADDDWTNLQRLQPDDAVQVVQTNLRSIEGQYRSSSPTELVVAINGVERRLAQSEVARVSRRQKTHRLRNGALLALAGAAVGAASFRFGNACAETDNGCRNTRLATVGGAAAGAGIGAAIPGGSELIYRAASIP